MNENIAPDLVSLARRVATLKLHERNARTHDARNLAAIAESLKRFGQQKPIVVASDGVVVAGNGTLQAALSLGWEHIAVVQLAFDSNHPESRGYAIADNRTGDLSQFDQGVLRSEIDALRETVDFTTLGFDATDVETLRSLDAGAATLPPGLESGAPVAAKTPPPPRAPRTSLVYRVVVECADEHAQAALVEELEARGLKCQPLIS